MIHHLKNEHYQVGIKQLGAELCSFRSVTEKLEYIWQAEPEFWNRYAPVLFPIVGKVPDGKYQYQGQTYELPQHGFARDLDFEVTHQTDSEITFETRSTPETLEKYPFEFVLQIKYTLQENNLEVAYQVQNKGAGEMLFSIGGHPGFVCPLLPDEQFTDYYLEFEKPETLNRYLITDGLQNGETQPVLNNQAILPLHYDLFAEDAIVLKGMQSERISIKSNKNNKSIDFEFKDYPFFGIWTKGQDAPFICLEPWHGIASSLTDSGDLESKEGILKLNATETFHCAYTIRVH